ncbi:Uncharacterized protein K02A2.6 [Trachymyrmex zeteki]|uniref:Uncharacterized protein K02A2.6 n=1 Tax=Mycetomoellerius zeteki TaxID=64791 RepID=A0A151XH05_9HYME|nr:Uncharacterized protein K02A2.6 [Trachymyrmex zeteki]
MIRQRNKQNKNEKGTLEFSLGNLFKCVCCVYSGISYEEKRLNEINESIQQINKRLNLLDRLHAANIEANNVTQSSNVNIFPYFPMEETRKEEIHKGIELQHMTDKSDEGNVLYKDVDDDESDILTQESATSSQDRSSFLISPYWLQDERLRRGVVDFLSNDEEEFWKDLIGKYLQPIESDEESQNKITQELINCRDAYLSKFFMLNALFVLIVFLMQLNKDRLHLQWPLGMKYNITYYSEKNEVHLTKEYLRLEPIGCLFIVAFVSILGIQFCAMLFHRFDTFSHVLANTKLPSCTKCEKAETKTIQKLLELALKNETALSEMSASIHKLNAKQKFQNKHKKNTTTASTKAKYKGDTSSAAGQLKCFACGNTNHNFSNCRYKKYKCKTCNEMGHISKVCKKAEASANYLSDQAENQSAIESIKATIEVNGKSIVMKMDSGAGMSVLSYNIYRNTFKEITLHSSNIKLKMYDGSIVTPVGEIFVTANFGKRFVPARLYRYVFEPSIGTYKYEKIQLSIKDNVSPIFCKPRPIPFAFRDLVDAELIKLEKQGIITKVESSGAHLYLTVNPHLEDINYPLPKIEEIFTAVQGGQKFTKLDFKNAFNQLLLDYA